MDELDKKLIFELDKNVRTPLARIARKLRVNRNVLLYRYNRMLEEGVIKGSYIEVNVMGLGYLTFRMLVKLSHVASADVSKLLAELEKMSAITFLSRVKGPWDLDIVYTSRTVTEFDSFRIRFFEMYNSFIESYNIAILSSIYSYEKSYLIGADRSHVVVKKFAPSMYVADDLDLKLLRALSRDARKTLPDLANECGCSMLTARRRLKLLEKNGILLYYRPFLNLEKMGYSYYKLHLALRYYSAKDLIKLRGFVELKNFVIYTDHFINSEEFEIEVQVPTQAAYLEFLAELYAEFGTIIKSSYDLEFYDQRVYRYLP